MLSSRCSCWPEPGPYAGGLDPLLGTYRWLDLTPLGRQRHVTEFPYHDTYGQDS